MKKLIVLITLITMNLFSYEIDLQKAKELALSRNNSFQSKEQDLLKSELNVNSAFMKFLPSASLTGRISENLPAIESQFGDNETNSSYGLSVNQSLFSGGKNWYNYQLQKDNEEISKNELSKEKLSLISEVEKSYYNLLEQKELFSIAEKSYNLATKNESLAKIKFDSGVISKADLLRLSSSRASEEVNLINAEKMYQIAKINFSILTGVSQEFELKQISLDKYDDFVAQLNSFGTIEIEQMGNILSSISLKQNYDLKNMDVRKEMAEKNITISKGNFLPSLSLSFSKDWSKSNLDDSFGDRGTISLNASIPIFPVYDNYLNLEKSKIDLKKSELSKKDLQDNVDLNLKSTLYSLISGSKKLKSSALLLQLAEETYSRTEERFKSGAESETELIDARVSMISAKNNYASSIYSFLNIKRELMVTAGYENEKEFIQLFER